MDGTTKPNKMGLTTTQGSGNEAVPDTHSIFIKFRHARSSAGPRLRSSPLRTSSTGHRKETQQATPSHVRTCTTVTAGAPPSKSSGHPKHRSTWSLGSKTRSMKRDKAYLTQEKRELSLKKKREKGKSKGIAISTSRKHKKHQPIASSRTPSQNGLGLPGRCLYALTQYLGRAQVKPASDGHARA